MITVQKLHSEFNTFSQGLVGALGNLNVFLTNVRNLREDVMDDLKSLMTTVGHLQQRLDSFEAKSTTHHATHVPVFNAPDAQSIESKIAHAHDEATASAHSIIITGIPSSSSRSDKQCVTKVLASIWVFSIPESIRRLGSSQSVLKVKFDPSVKSFKIRQAFLKHRLSVPRFAQDEVLVKIDRPFALRCAIAKLFSTLDLLKESHANLNPVLGPGLTLSLCSKYSYSLDAFFFPFLCLPEEAGLMAIPGPDDKHLEIIDGSNCNFPKPKLL